MDRPYALFLALDQVPSDATIDALLDENISITQQAGLTSAEALWDGPSAEDAALSFARALQHHGLTAERFVPDLVTKAGIAQRARVSKPAVSAWVSNTTEVHFPAPYANNGQGFVWLWHPVNEWLKSRGHHSDDWESPTLDEIRRIDGLLRESQPLKQQLA